MRTGAAGARAAVTALAVSVLLAACGSSPKPTASVAISSYAFHPAAVTVAPGTKVRFTNRDQTAHTATARNGAFDTGTLKPGRSATVTLTKPGTYTYYCQFHAFMTATVVVS